MPEMFPRSIAIAGAWGYIGRKFLDAACELGLDTTVFDPGSMPEDLDGRSFTRIDDETDFYRTSADLFHLAVHPEHRTGGIDALLARGSREPVLILCEKPMASPERPDDCPALVDAAARAEAVMLFDFPELIDPMTARIVEFLAQFRRVDVASIYVQRSKDREDHANVRNRKRMVPIQFQESVHCLAFVLNLLAHVRGSVEAVAADGISLTATSRPYDPPNPEAYPYVVDGRCEFRMNIGPTAVEGLTDFTRGAPWTKRRTIRGTGDGRPFAIDADYLEGEKRLTIDGAEQTDVVKTDSYAETIKTSGRWFRDVPAETLRTGRYPNPAFARVTYQLSSALWHGSRTGRSVAFDSLKDVLAFDAQFAAAVPSLPRYSGEN